MSEILDKIYIWVFLVNSESGPLLVFVKYMLYSPCSENCIFLYFLEAKNPCFVTKSCSKSSYICAFILSKKQHNFVSKKTFITLERLVVESCPTPRWMAFLMLYQLVYNIRSCFNELILAWSAYLKINVSNNQSVSFMWNILWEFI